MAASEAAATATGFVAANLAPHLSSLASLGRSMCAAPSHQQAPLMQDFVETCHQILCLLHAGGGRANSNTTGAAAFPLPPEEHAACSRALCTELRACEDDRARLGQHLSGVSAVLEARERQERSLRLEMGWLKWPLDTRYKAR